MSARTLCAFGFFAALAVLPLVSQDSYIRHVSIIALLWALRSYRWRA